MKKITDILADQEYDVEIEGVVRKYRIVPEISGKLRAHLYFWENLDQNSIQGIELTFYVDSILNFFEFNCV